MSVEGDPKSVKSYLAELLADEMTTEPMLDVSLEQTCHPHQMMLEPKTESARCTKCKKSFTAYEALRYVARNTVHLRANIDSMKRDLESLREKREVLRKQVQSLKGQRDRAQVSKVAREAGDILKRPREDGPK